MNYLQGTFERYINLVLCAGLHGGRVRQNMSVAKASNCTNLGVCVICPLIARVSSMWGFGGNWSGGLHIKMEYMHLIRLQTEI